jgi:hypothetical protein
MICWFQAFAFKCNLHRYSWVKKAHLRNIEKIMGPLRDEEKRLLRLNGAGAGGDDAQRSRLTTDERMQEYVDKVGLCTS